MTTSRPSAARNFALIGFILSAGFGIFVLTGRVAGHPSPALTSFPLMIAAIWSGVAMLWVARGMEPKERRAWTFMGIGALAFAGGEAVWAYYDLILGADPPYPGVADILYLAGYPLWMIGIVGFPYARGTRFDRSRLLLDGAAGTTALVLLMWQLYLKDFVTFEGSTFFERVVNPAYPLADILLLTGLLILSMRRAPRRLHRSLLILALCFVLFAVADVLWLLFVDSYVPGTWYDGLWIIGYGLTMLASWAASRNVRSPAIGRRLSSPDVLVPYVMVAALFVVGIYRTVVGDVASDIRVLVLGSAAVSVIIIIRQAIAFGEYREVVGRERQDLVSSISHELRTPLTAMQGFTDLLASDWTSFSDQERTELLGSVAEQTHYLTRIVSDLIDVSRGRMAAAALSTDEYLLEDIVDDALAMSKHGQNLEVSSELPRGAHIYCDRGRMTQILVNLLTNAARYGRGRVLLTARSQPGHLVIEVHDDGPGVPVKYQELIWESFERGAHRLDAKTPGTGLGLAIVKGLVQAHGATIAYRDSDRLGGACFSITMPIVSVDLEAAAPAVSV